MEFAEDPNVSAATRKAFVSDHAILGFVDRTAELAREVLTDPSLAGMPVRPGHERVLGDDLRVWTAALSDPPSAPELERVFRARATAHAALGLRCEEAVLQQHACATVLLHAMTCNAPGAPERVPSPHVLRERALDVLRTATSAVVRQYRLSAESTEACPDDPVPRALPAAPPAPAARPVRPAYASAASGQSRNPASARPASAPRWCLAAAQLGHGAKAALQRFRAANPQALIAVTGTNVTVFADQYPNLPDVLGPYGVVAIEDGDTTRAARRAALAAIVARHYGVRVDTRQALPLIAALDMPPEERETFVAACLGPLHTDMRHRYLLETLSTYLAHSLCVTAAARSLYVHRHTLTYRLRTIENLTGLDLGNAFDRMRAELTLILCQSSGWTVPRQRSA
ncbi:hypothetical protein SALBM135S_08474 [Streptomyces alboniger]